MPEQNTEDTIRGDAKLQALPKTTQEDIGWSGIETHMREYDEGEMKVLNDDIDALLIFAGLFSAVLTAFVVPSYLLLQPDNSQLTVQLLSRISAQLARFEILPPFINSTASDISASPEFQVSTSARWMNCLWFLSLIFSLSSALFGILAKQWIREYLQWRKVAAAPRENILLRQLRIEAWDGWKVSAGISAIPALLEMAVVLFLAGLVVLVWTLDTVVAVIITTAVSIVILILCTVTILPAVYYRCPYKSPTGWACVVIFDALTVVVLWTKQHFELLAIFIEFLWSVLFLIAYNLPSYALGKIWQWIVQPARPLAAACSSRIRHFLSSRRDSLPPFPRFSNWRERDLSTNDVGSSEILSFDDVGLPETWVSTAKTRVAKDICQVMPLVRALSWVRKSTEDPRLLQHVVASVESIHRDNIDAEDRYYIFTYVLRKLYSAESEPREFQPLGQLEDQLQSKAHKIVGKGQLMFRGGVDSGYGYIDPPVIKSLDYSDRWVLGYLLFSDTMYSLGSASGGSKHTTNFMCLLRHFLQVSLSWNDGSLSGDIFNPTYRARLQKCYNDAIHSQSEVHQNLRSSGAHTMMLEILCSVNEVRMAEGIGLISADVRWGSRPNVDNEIRLALQMFHQNSAFYSDPRYTRHQFVMMADLVMRSLNTNYFFLWDYNLVGTLLQKMSEAVTTSLKNGYNNCGCYHDFPWISSILLNVTMPYSTSLRNLPAQPLWSLIEVLEKGLGADASNNQGGPLLTGENIRTDFVELKKWVEKAHPRPRSADEPLADVGTTASDSQVINSSGPIQSNDIATEDGGIDGGVRIENGRNDVLDSRLYSEAAGPLVQGSPQRAVLSTEAVRVRSSGTRTRALSLDNHCRMPILQTTELQGLINKHAACSSERYSNFLAITRDRGGIPQPFIEPIMGQSESLIPSQQAMTPHRRHHSI
ncbi:hypothetical protein PHLCEN_2v11502 [Hermanssonia centrifuga]|uniref:DUF6535 domain-containing protein n=1 Tax=Hermanssonia centrifuga TaxID=98765 RepID=A0A2R6NK51_9APHY|nr:hypothetical protein PHLCEN_2v11502 [Hermanssonia centrifuga]